MDKYNVARDTDATPRVPVATIEWDASRGVVVVTPVSGRITDRERDYLLAHFQGPAETNSGGYDPKTKLLYDKYIRLQPGTLAHYRAAAYSLRGVFQNMGKA